MVKKILLTGTNSYVGNCLNHYLSEAGFIVDSISVRNNDWETSDFSQYDCIIHLAALVHNNEPNADMKRFMDVNYHLTRKLADKAKLEGVKHFIFFSTMSVYGLDGRIGKPEEINIHTPLNPVTHYGISKLKAEAYLQKLQDDHFVISIVRPPMIYGPGAPGNFRKLQKYAEKVPFYLDINNERSAIYIDNLMIYIKYVIDHSVDGVLIPQNQEYLKTNEVITSLRSYNGKRSMRIILPKKIQSLLGHISIFNKLYGNLTYYKEIDKLNNQLNFVDKKESYINSITK